VNSVVEKQVVILSLCKYTQSITSLYVETKTACHEALPRAHVLLPALHGLGAFASVGGTNEGCFHGGLIRWRPYGPNGVADRHKVVGYDVGKVIRPDIMKVVTIT
jgi:hypothetical protein